MTLIRSVEANFSCTLQLGMRITIGKLRPLYESRIYLTLQACDNLLQPLRVKDFLESWMHPYLIAGIERLKRMADKTTEVFEERHASET